MSATAFRHAHRVSYAECTVGNHVYYARYLDILEAARGEFFRHLGAPLLELQNQDVIFPVIECRLRYKAPARYDDWLTVELWPSAIEKVRLSLVYRVTNQNGTLILDGEIQHVCTSVQEKLKRIPDELAAKLQAYRKIPSATSAQ